MILFDKTGRDNTDGAAELAVAKAKENGYDIVAASNMGDTAWALVRAAEKLGFGGRIVIVTQTTTAAKNGINVLDPQVKAELKAKGVTFVTAAHVLSGAERGISTRFQGAYPVEIMAHTLRTFGAGTKVCFECAVMALNADEIEYGKPVVAVGGTGRGADTVCVITPAYAANILDTKVHEIICKPSLM